MKQKYSVIISKVRTAPHDCKEMGTVSSQKLGLK
jgi:hypothetical protein